MKSHITTKRGDTGETTALDGTSYSKAHSIFDCVGAVDELRAHTALVRLRLLEERPNDYEACARFLFWLLHTYFLIGAACSNPARAQPDLHKREIGPRHLEKLEMEQARLEAQLELPDSFIMAAATTLAAQIDIAATVARRLERHIVKLKRECPAFQTQNILPFVNRLSDFLYILARYVEGPSHQAVNYDLLDA